jgi:hypothetical protein
MVDKKVSKKISNLSLSFVAILGLLLGLREVTNFNAQDILMIAIGFFFVALISILVNQITKLEENLKKINERAIRFENNLEIWKEINKLKYLIENEKKKK